MRKPQAYDILVLFMFLLAPLWASAESSFDRCVDALHRNGGLSLRESQELCLTKPSEQTQSCQNKLFQIAFKHPQTSFEQCSRNPEADAFYQGELFRGYFEQFPLNIKKTICTITVNSTEERDSFRRILPSSNYEVVELLPERQHDRFVSRDSYWLERSCNAQVRCDALVFSGHFADSFIGDAGFEVSMADLKRYQSQSSCKPFFENIKEVYLFGCNTMATKKPDHRSIQQYISVLVEDGVAPHTAQRIAARRYTRYDHSVAEKMKDLFPQASFIAGFPSTGPTGQRIQPILERYLKMIQTNDTLQTRTQAFQKTLGRTGMILSSSTQHDSAKSLPLDNSVILNAADVTAFIQQYGGSLPVAAVDLLGHAQKQNVLDENTFTNLQERLKKAWNKLAPYEQTTLLCPLLLADNEKWVPENLNCFTDTSWLSMN